MKNKLIRLGTLLSALMIVLNLLVSIPLPVRAEGFSTDPDAPQNQDEEVGFWVERTTIILFNNSIPIPSDPTTNTITYDIFRADNDRGPLNYDDVVYKGKNDPSCTLTVRFTSDNRTPDSGTLSDSCQNIDKSVRLAKNADARLDGWYKSTDGSETGNRRGSTSQIYMPVASSDLANCPGGNGSGSANIYSDSYAEHTYKKGSDPKGKDDLDFTYGAGKTKRPNKDGTGGVWNGLVPKDYDSTTHDYDQYYQILFCPDNNATASGDESTWTNVLGYGLTGTTAGKGRVVYVSHKDRDKILAKYKETAEAYIAKKQRYAAYVRFFQDNPDALAIPEGCYNTFIRGGATGNALIEYTAIQLSTPIRGPYYDCLRAYFDASEWADDFAAIDAIQPADVAAPPRTSSTNDECSIGIPVIGDLMCGFIELIFNSLAEAFEKVIVFFGDTSDTFSKLQDSTGMQESWAAVKNLSNIVFLIAFFFVIFQYLLDLNVVDAYFVKKFLPRLIIAVVLAQASFWIVTEMNYMATDLGKSVQSLVLFSQSVSTVDAPTIATGKGAIAQLTSGSGPFGVFGIGAFAIALIIGILMLAVLLISILLLTVREIVLVVLAILSPLAFACIAIPQFEGMFKKWINMYIKLLAIFPIMMLFLALGTIIGDVFSNPSMNPIYQLMGFIAYFMPFILLPFTFKMAGGVVGSIGGKLTSMATGAAKNKGKDMYGNSQFALGRAKKKENKRAIRSDRAGNRQDEKLAERMSNAQKKSGLRARFANQRLYGGVGGTEAERARYAGAFDQKTKKRKREDADLAVASSIAGIDGMEAKNEALMSTYRNAVQSGDAATADAAYATLVGNKANDELASIQADAWAAPAGSAAQVAYNRQQGENYGALGEFAPHLRGEVDATKTAEQHRVSTLRSMSDDQLSQVNKKTWEAWRNADEDEASARMVSIVSKGGGAASKISAEVKGIMAGVPSAAARAGRTDSDIEAGVPLALSPEERASRIDAAKKDRDTWKSALNL